VTNKLYDANYIYLYLLIMILNLVEIIYYHIILYNNKKYEIFHNIFFKMQRLVNSLILFPTEPNTQ
jgi:hypothetical protein